MRRFRQKGNYPKNHQTDDTNNEGDNHFDTNSIFNGFVIITLPELVTKFTPVT